MNNRTEFCFSTRTLTDDYKIYADNGAVTLASEYFSDYRRKCDATSDNQRVTALYEEDGKFYLAAFNVPTRRRDTSGRVISFSFCLTFLDNGADARREAQRAYLRLTNEKTEVMAKIDELFDERKIYFDTLRFVEWLCFDDIKDVGSAFGNDDWPRKNFVLRSCEEEVLPSLGGEVEKWKKQALDWKELAAKRKIKFVLSSFAAVAIALVACSVLFLKSGASGVDEMKRENLRLSNQLDEKKSEVKQLTAQIRSLNEQIDEVYANKNSTAADLARENGNLRNKSKQQEDRIKKLEEERDSALRDKDTYGDRLAKRAGKIERLEADVESRDKLIEELKDKIRKLENGKPEQKTSQIEEPKEKSPAASQDAGAPEKKGPDSK